MIRDLVVRCMDCDRPVAVFVAEENTEDRKPEVCVFCGSEKVVSWEREG